MPMLKRERVEIEYNGAMYEFYVRELAVKDYMEVLRFGVGNQGKLRAIANEPVVLEFDLVSYTLELVRRAVENFGEFGSVENLPREIFGKLASKALELNPFPEFLTG